MTFSKTPEHLLATSGTSYTVLSGAAGPLSRHSLQTAIMNHNTATNELSLLTTVETDEIHR